MIFRLLVMDAAAAGRSGESRPAAGPDDLRRACYGPALAPAITRDD
jgi:hypothetical protein